MAPIRAAVFATLLMNDAYLPGAMVLGHSLKDKGAKAPLVAFILVDRLSSDTITELRTVYDEIVPIQEIKNKNPANLYLMNRADLISTFTKIELWRQTQFKRIVYLDADMVVIRAPNELLTLDTNFAAVPDIGWPDLFNSGMMVLNPNMADYYSLYALAQRGISFDGADQGLLNMHFREWERLSFVYNCTPSGHYQYIPAYRHFSSSIAAVHFIGKDKPWTLGRDNKLNTGVYGELLGMWWSVYDRHYRPKTATYYDAQTFDSSKKVQDYVRGEEPLYVVGYSSGQSGPGPIPQPQHEYHHPSEQHHQHPHHHGHQQGQQHHHEQHQQEQHNQHHHPAASEHTGQIPLPPEIQLSHSQSGQTTSVELPLGDAPTPKAPSDFHPVPTVEQRRFSAPHAEWDPAREPPPAHSKPEAANFPTTIYDMSSETALFQPPAHYPEAPKDMWYQVPEKVPEPEKPKPIFPWETRAPKPTRVFPQPRQPSPPPAAPEPAPVVPEEVTTPSVTTDATGATEESVLTPPAAPVDLWASFQQRTNAWDDMPEIERYVQSISQPRKGKIQVLYNTLGQRSPQNTSGATTPTARERRRPSIKLTDFPTKDERPSLPVTPAPIRRPTFWGDEKEEEGSLPTAEGVPKQEEWVRRFSHYPQPEFPASHPPSHDARRVLHWRCQYCGKQNPITKLEQLQLMQSEALLSPTGTRELGQLAEPPTRKMPESSTKEEVEKAVISHISPTKVPKAPKPILKPPHFELGQDIVGPEETPTRGGQQDEDSSEVVQAAQAKEESVDPLSRPDADEEGAPPEREARGVVAPTTA
ncbi:uncharacterized protein Z520_07571 [Fonsecaea multimorphosa CBS 102226]|uniref:glycogenin glucosyltransferase n=1 Tax=Fonsecaea multimorphosa CBS 102226 TaxID=1442371 RepID=A0A0D2IIL2_9EURO|nr:uncharacterized protein Z520_07571 [Fonsecaea multimorphosa CBS 102226]KIX96851.1 hypothetical protein Z520_07571 [Fonsecaea multimorphosa CBS 102226]OAL22530.1 hypothetical protein AYO22_07088 [Fonsecaea multimorphosa]